MDLSILEDKELVSRYIQGEEKAFEVLLLRYKNRVYNFIYMKLRDVALSEDIFQETFIKVIKTLKKGKYNEQGKFLSWVMRIAHNLIIDHFRRTNKVKMVSESTSLSDDFNVFKILKIEDANVEDEMAHQELVSQVLGLIDYLSDSQREIIQMRIFKGMSFKDIAEKENISINTALGRMRYALINLRKLIEQYGIERSIA